MFKRFKSKPKKIQFSQIEIPSIILITTNFIKTNALDIEYIFRIPGRISDVEELKNKLLNSDSNLNLSEYSIHVVGSVLKDFLRCEDPLIPFKLYKPFLRLQTKNEQKDQKIAKLLLLLPERNQVILQYLMQFLWEIASHSKENKMDASNLSIVFGPNIIRKKKTNPKKEMKDFDKIKNLTTFLIENEKKIFENVEQFRGKKGCLLPNDGSIYSTSDPSKLTHSFPKTVCSLPTHFEKNNAINLDFDLDLDLPKKQAISIVTGFHEPIQVQNN
ncbi:spermathecal physiology variant [Anaeramoeba ignava]|uniref:Spermathecal physiology variant n=1 Tax=Anaeramoeba ignava TaxID=1746090 RepID=A0A9Q0L7U5_ANAIG|nr:spermathecal physiology variant [Anaeramoeba ignava]